MPTHSFWESLRVQYRVIHALFMREIITRYGRHNIGFLWLFVEPMLFTLGVMAVWSLMNLNKSGIPIVAFAITGYSCVLLWRNAASRTIKAIEPNLSLMYHRNVKVFDIFIARILLEIMGATISIGSLTIIFAVTGWMEWPMDILTALFGWFMLSWFAVGMGLVFGALSELSELVDRIWHVATYLFFPFSGAAYMVEWLPENGRQIVLWLPMVHGTEMIRNGYFGGVIPTHENVYYLFAVNLCMTFIGLLLVRHISTKVQPE